jgi:3-oxoacyl-[acyl-carrier protein] reductase
MLLTGRIAIVTGASRGIGRSVAIELAAEGARVVLASRSVDDLSSVADEITTSGGEALVVATDVSKAEEVEQLVSECSRRFGAADILVNNAGAVARATVHEMSIAAWDEVIGTNLRGTFLCTKAVIGSMLDNRKGDVFIISSNRARRGKATRSAYCAAKAAVRIFGESLRDEVREYNVRVHTFILAGVDTPMIRASYPATSPSVWIESKHVGRMVVHCASQPDIVDTPEIELRSLASGD